MRAADDSGLRFGENALIPAIVQDARTRRVLMLGYMDRAALDQRIEELTGTLDMGDFIDRRTEGFSQGQRVKVAIARAVVHRPQTVLLDEPRNGLDVMSTRALRNYVRGLREAGRCVVLSTHIMQEVAALCDRIVIIAKGEVAAEGTAAELLEEGPKRDRRLREAQQALRDATGESARMECAIWMVCRVGWR